jgi:hypothetical protein
MPCLPEEIGQYPPDPLPLPVSEAPPALPPDTVAPLVAPSAPAAAAVPTPPAAAPTPATPPAPITESSRYRVAYGLLGELGHIDISFVYPATGGDTVQASGVGSGSLMGMGQFEKKIDSQLDSRALTSRRWVTTRAQSGRTISDTIEQARPGSVELVRKRSDRPDEGHRFVRQQPVLDPLGFLHRVRARPPRAAEAFEVLDGRALWLITLTPGTAGKLDNGRKALAFQGRATPIFWDGQLDGERTARTFTLWLEDDRFRTPLRLVMPLPVGEVRVELAAVKRPNLPPPARLTADVVKMVRLRPGVISRPSFARGRAE